MMRKSVALVFAGLLSILLFAGIASAHVVVYPKETTQGTYEKFTVRVPSEKEAATVKVEVKIPDDVDISRFEPKPGWKYELTKDASGKITSVTWTATGEGLSSTEFGEFNMQGKVGDDATALTWKAYQTYQDGEVVEWVGAEGSDTPASVTEVKAKAAETMAADQANGQNRPEAFNLSLYLSIAALAVAVLALILALIKKRA